MTYAEIHPSLRQAIGNFEGFRKLGFAPDDLYVILAASPLLPESQLMVFMALRLEDREFSIECGPWEKSEDQAFPERWIALCEAWNAGQVSQDDMDRIWHESAAHLRAVEMGMGLIAKGFQIPEDGGDLS